MQTVPNAIPPPPPPARKGDDISMVTLRYRDHIVVGRKYIIMQVTSYMNALSGYALKHYMKDQYICVCLPEQ